MATTMTMIAALLGCEASRPSDILVAIYSDVEPHDDLELEVRFPRLDEPEETVRGSIIFPLDDRPFPRSFGLRSDSPVETVFALEFSLQDGSGTLSRTSLTTQYSPMRQVVLPVGLFAACADDCGAQTCQVDFGEPECVDLPFFSSDSLAELTSEEQVPVGCEGDERFCPDGFACLPNRGAGFGRGVCARICEGDRECRDSVGEGSHCLSQVGADDLAFQGCTHPCELSGSLPNGGCPLGSACDHTLTSSGYTYCRSHGDGLVGEACSESEPCAERHHCEDGICLRYCRPGFDDCSDAQSCIDRGVAFEGQSLGTCSGS